MKERGFSRKKLTFYRDYKDTIGLINFQKSIRSKAECVIFTINIGIISRRLYCFFKSVDNQSIDLSLDNCHLRERIGFLLTDRQDKWWAIDANTDLDFLFDKICNDIQTFALPEIQKFNDDEALRDLWLSARSPGLTDFQRLMNLTVLLKILGPSERLAPVIDELQQRVEGQLSASTAELHLKKLMNATASQKQ